MTPRDALAVLGTFALVLGVGGYLVGAVDRWMSRRAARAAARKLGLLLAVLSLLVPGVPARADCGEERAAVKLGTDADARKVPLEPQDATIAELALRPRPGKTPEARRAVDERSTERTVWRLSGTVTGYKLEADGDYHIVLSDEHGTTMIVEIPDPGCAATGAWSAQVLAARTAFRRILADRRLGEPGKKLHAGGFSVVVTGVGFFDKIHGQSGVAKNGVELHPVMSVESGGRP